MLSSSGASSAKLSPLKKSSEYIQPHNRWLAEAQQMYMECFSMFGGNDRHSRVRSKLSQAMRAVDQVRCQGATLKDACECVCSSAEEFRKEFEPAVQKCEDVSGKISKLFLQMKSTELAHGGGEQSCLLDYVNVEDVEKLFENANTAAGTLESIQQETSADASNLRRVVDAVLRRIQDCSAPEDAVVERLRRGKALFDELSQCLINMAGLRDSIQYGNEDLHSSNGRHETQAQNILQKMKGQKLELKQLAESFEMDEFAVQASMKSMRVTVTWIEEAADKLKESTEKISRTENVFESSLSRLTAIVDELSALLEWYQKFVSGHESVQAALKEDVKVQQEMQEIATAAMTKAREMTERCQANKEEIMTKWAQYLPPELVQSLPPAPRLNIQIQRG